MTDELERAKARLAVARGRVTRYQAAYGKGRVDRDLERRLSDALRAVRALEMAMAVEGMLSA